MRYIMTYEKYERYDKYPVIEALNNLLKIIFANTSVCYRGIDVIEAGGIQNVRVSSIGKFIEIYFPNSSHIFDDFIKIFKNCLISFAKEVSPSYKFYNIIEKFGNAIFKISKEYIDLFIQILIELENSEDLQLYVNMKKYNL